MQKFSSLNLPARAGSRFGVVSIYSPLVRAIPIAGALLGFSGVANAVDITSGDWKFSFNGNINVHYIYSSCEDSTSAKSIVTVGGACTGSATGSSVSNVSNGLLPAAMSFGVSTTQAGLDLSGHFGLYPGISTNDGGSPNVQQGAPAGSNVGLGTTGLDVRQVYMSFGNKEIGTFMLGRNFGLFGFDAIIDDMTIVGVGVPGAMSSATPANTTLGSIGFGYIYTDTLAQMNYTTPDYSGFNATVGIYDPLNSLTAAGTSTPKGAPGVHGKLAYTHNFAKDTKLYLSTAAIQQKQSYVIDTTSYSYSALGIDVLAKLNVDAFEALAYYYHGSGLGTTALFVLSDDGLGNKRNSAGYLLQGTYTIDKVKLGVNYGVSKLDYANSGDEAAVPNLLDSNSKITGGVYYALTKNLTLLTEVSDINTKAHNDDKNHSNSFNAGAFFSF
jgi:predicted porin